MRGEPALSLEDIKRMKVVITHLFSLYQSLLALEYNRMVMCLAVGRVLLPPRNFYMIAIGRKLRARKFMLIQSQTGCTSSTVVLNKVLGLVVLSVNSEEISKFLSFIQQQKSN